MKRLTDIGLCLALLSAPLLVALGPIDSGDAWWHLAVGHRVLDTGEWVLSEPFTHTAAGHPFTPQEWLSQVIYAGIDRLFGLVGVRVWTAILVLIGGVLIATRARLAGLNRGQTAVCMAAVAPGLAFLVEPRPHMFSFVFLGLFACLYLRRKTPSWWIVAAAVPLACMWANFHAVGLLAPILTGAAWVESWRHRHEADEAPTRRFAVVIAAALGTLITPSGLHLYEYVFLNTGRASTLIDEWQPFWFADGAVQSAGWPVMVAAFAALGLGVFGITTQLKPRASNEARSWSTRGVLLTAGLSYLILSARRWLWLGWIPSLQGLRALPSRGKWPLLWWGLALALAVMPYFNPRVQERLRAETWSQGSIARTAALPKDSAEFLDELNTDVCKLTGNLYHPYHWGGFLVYRLWPKWQAYLYGETAVFLEAGIIQERQRVELGSESEALEILDRREVRALVLPRFGREGRPSRPPGGDRPGERWLRAFANFRERVWLRRDDSEAVEAAASYYRQHDIPWNEDWGFLEHHALIGNPEWALRHEILRRINLDALEPLTEALRRNPGDAAARAQLARQFEQLRLMRSATVLRANS